MNHYYMPSDYHKSKNPIIKVNDEYGLGVYRIIKLLDSQFDSECRMRQYSTLEFYSLNTGIFGAKSMIVSHMNKNAKTFVIRLQTKLQQLDFYRMLNEPDYYLPFEEHPEVYEFEAKLRNWLKEIIQKRCFSWSWKDENNSSN